MNDHLGTWTFEPYISSHPSDALTLRLSLWDTYRTRDGKSELRYCLSIVEGSAEYSRNPITFEGADFYPSPLHAIDSDATAAALIGFFAYYAESESAREEQGFSERQSEALTSHADALTLWGMELDPDA
jgi:hypothetical protein